MSNIDVSWPPVYIFFLIIFHSTNENFRYWHRVILPPQPPHGHVHHQWRRWLPTPPAVAGVAGVAGATITNRARDAEASWVPGISFFTNDFFYIIRYSTCTGTTWRPPPPWFWPPLPYRVNTRPGLPPHLARKCEFGVYIYILSSTRWRPPSQRVLSQWPTPHEKKPNDGSKLRQTRGLGPRWVFFYFFLRIYWN